MIAWTAASADLLEGRIERRACHRATVAGAGVIAEVTVGQDGAVGYRAISQLIFSFALAS